ncbi:MAG: Adenylate/guanylate cyclase [Acidimicrobiales bacterium]|nr:Adenylate/guanylate cyclase [Acidimicrobiales bacterium]
MLGRMGASRPGSSAAPAARTHTFLFTDVQGSTRRWQADPEAMATALAEHDRLLHAAVTVHGGRVFKNTGDGMCAVFESATEAVRAALEAQRRLQLPVRMAIHSGEAIERDDDFFGVDLSRCARLMEAGHGGQVLVSASAASVASIDNDVVLLELGEHRLRDLRRPERVFQAAAPGLTRDFPPLRSLNAVRHNLPVQRSSFVGREVELTELRERLLAEQLVTLTGIGGCGKTRLALEVSAGLVELFPQGVFFVDLALLSDPDLVGQAVASAIGLQLLDASVDALTAYLTGRRVLLVLDNCEHLLEPCADLVDDLLAGCPDLRVLATSREALGLDGERAFRVPSLGIESDAAALFVDRARARRPDLRLDPDAERAVIEICRRLDGIPLAIELAAARTSQLAPVQILERLGDRFALLTGGRRRVQRQQTLAATIAWSHDLLGPAEQLLLRRLAVFRGSLSLQAAEEICHPDALDLLGSLIAKSLVNVQDDEAVVRYRLLETVRLYAEERLVQAGEADELRSRHRDWFLGWIEGLPVGPLLVLGGGDDLAPEADNLAEALDWSRQQQRPDLVARIASRMSTYWWTYVRMAEMAASWQELEAELPRLPAGLKAAALLVGAQYAMAVGAFDQMERLSADALAAAMPGTWMAASAWGLQALYWSYDDPERGRQAIEQGRAAAAAAGLPEIEVMITGFYANLITGDRLHDEALGVFETLDHVVDEATDRAYMTASMVAAILSTVGQKTRAARLAATLPADSPLQRYMRELVGIVIASNDGDSKAMAAHLQALAAIAQEHAVPLGEASCLGGLAAVAVAEGDHERASRLLATLRNAAPFPFRTPLEVLLYRRSGRAVGAALDADTIRRCRAEGAATSVGEAIASELLRLDELYGAS